MVTIASLHLILIGIYFLVASQVAPFEVQLLSYMMSIGIILIILGIIFRIIKTIGMKIKKELKADNPSKQKFVVSKNNYFTYFLILVALIFTVYGIMTMPNST